MTKIIDNQLYAGGAKIPGTGGGGGGTDNYNDLSNKPKINGVTLSGNKTSADLGIKNVITLTGESGTLTAEQIAQVLDDTAVLEIVCDGEVFRLSNKDSTLTYRTFMNTNCEASENVSFKVIYIQLNQEAVNYGVWTLEQVSAGGTTITSTTATLTVAGWSNKSQTVSVSGITASNDILVSPAPASATDWASAGILCAAQGTNSLTFTCQTVPTNDITVNVAILN